MAENTLNPIARALLAAMGIDETNVASVRLTSDAHRPECIEVAYHLRQFGGMDITTITYEVKAVKP